MRFLRVFVAILPGTLADVEGCVVHSDGISTCSKEAAKDDATIVQQEGTSSLDEGDDGVMLSLMQKRMKIMQGIKQDKKEHVVENGINLDSMRYPRRAQDTPQLSSNTYG